MKKRISVVQCILTVVFVVTLLLSNIIVNKQIEIPFGLVVSGGFFTFPITYILSFVNTFFQKKSKKYKKRKARSNSGQFINTYL